MAAVGTSGKVTLVEIKRSLVPAKWEDSVREVAVSESKEAGLSLAHAFAADDFAKYLVDSHDMDGLAPEDKWRLHVDIMTYLTAAHCLDGAVTTIGPDYDSIALWLLPGQDLGGWWTSLRSGLWRLNFQLSAEGKKRWYEEVLPLLHDTKASVLGEREEASYYLAFLGTKPHARGRGYAKKQLEYMIQKADSENRPMYLESSAAGNIAYYKKFGFETKREISLDRGPTPVELFIMVREPRPARKVAYPSTAITKFQLGSAKA